LTSRDRNIKLLNVQIHRGKREANQEAQPQLEHEANILQEETKVKGGDNKFTASEKAVTSSKRCRTPYKNKRMGDNTPVFIYIAPNEQLQF